MNMESSALSCFKGSAGSQTHPNCPDLDTRKARTELGLAIAKPTESERDRERGRQRDRERRRERGGPSRIYDNRRERQQKEPSRERGRGGDERRWRRLPGRAAET